MPRMHYSPHKMYNKNGLRMNRMVNFSMPKIHMDHLFHITSEHLFHHVHITSHHCLHITSFRLCHHLFHRASPHSYTIDTTLLMHIFHAPLTLCKPHSICSGAQSLTKKNVHEDRRANGWVSGFCKRPWRANSKYNGNHPFLQHTLLIKFYAIVDLPLVYTMYFHHI